MVSGVNMRRADKLRQTVKWDCHVSPVLPGLTRWTTLLRGSVSSQAKKTKQNMLKNKFDHSKSNLFNLYISSRNRMCT